jgi:PST family polysaccharide transporter
MLGFMKKAAGFSVTIAIAVAFHNYWALIVGQFTIALADFAMSYMLSQYRPWFAVSGWRDILPFSKWMYLSNVLTYGSTRATHLIIGNQAGAHALGTYNVAYEVANLPTSELLAPTFRALLPGFSKLKTDIPRLRSLVVDVLSLAALVAIPAAVGIAVLAEQIVAVLLGPKWAEATGLVRVLAIFGAAVAIFSPLNAVNPAVGRVDVGAKVGLLNVLLALPTFTLLMMFSGLVSAAWGLVGARTAAGIVNLFLVSRWLGLDPLVIIRSVWRSAVAAIAMLIAVRRVSSALGQPSSAPAGIWQLFELVLLGILCYSAVVVVLWIVAGRPAGAETHTLALLRAAWDRMTRRAAKLQLFRS